jgi:hypothetical protein
MLVAFGRLWWRELRRYLTAAQHWVLPFHHRWVLVLGLLPLVRWFTAGGGALHMTDWTAAAFFLGLVEANRRAGRIEAPADVPAVT